MCILPQVERELAVRCGLQKPPRNLAPLVAGGPVVGVLSSSDDRSSNNSSSSARASSNSSNNNSLTDTRDNCYPGLVGRSVLVLCRTGIPLVQGAVLPVLALHEAMQLLICLLMLVLDLLVSLQACLPACYLAVAPRELCIPCHMAPEMTNVAACRVLLLVCAQLVAVVDVSKRYILLQGLLL